MSETAPHRPTTAYVAARCTRYCYAHGCPHATAANGPAFWRLRLLYAGTMAALAADGKGSHATANSGFYLVFMPGLLRWLT